MSQRPCLGCNRPTNGTRCTECQRIKGRERDARRAGQHKAKYGGQWRKLSERARRATPWCADCGATDDLTADHVTPGSLDGGVRVLCRSCNSRRGATHRYER